MKGIEYVVDEAGDRKAVVIDLAEHGELWEAAARTRTAHARMI